MFYFLKIGNWVVPKSHLWPNFFRRISSKLCVLCSVSFTNSIVYIGILPRWDFFSCLNLKGIAARKLRWFIHMPRRKTRGVKNFKRYTVIAYQVYISHWKLVNDNFVQEEIILITNCDQDDKFGIYLWSWWKVRHF